MIELRDPVLPVLTLSPETAFGILLAARNFDVKVENTDPNSGSNASDDLAVDVLEECPGDTAGEELKTAIEALSDAELRDLIALIWVGREDFALSEWKEARASAWDITRERAPRYVAGIPLVSDYLEDALSQFGHSLSEHMDTH